MVCITIERKIRNKNNRRIGFGKSRWNSIATIISALFDFFFITFLTPFVSRASCPVVGS